MDHNFELDSVCPDSASPWSEYRIRQLEMDSESFLLVSTCTLSRAVKYNGLGVIGKQVPEYLKLLGGAVDLGHVKAAW